MSNRRSTGVFVLAATIAVGSVIGPTGCGLPEETSPAVLEGDTGGDTASVQSELLLPTPGPALLSPAVVMGNGTACAIVSGGHVKCWGSNSSGQLGTGNTVPLGADMYDLLPFVNLGTGRTAKAISLGGSFACAILDNNSVKCWGDNSWGQLGLGDTNNRGDEPDEIGDSALWPAVNLGSGRTAKAISLGSFYACAVLDNNTLKCWGNDGAGQLGQDGLLGQNVGDAPDEMGGSLPPIFLGTGRTAKAVATGSNHTCAVLDNNTLKCWGYNEFACLGLGHFSPEGGTPGSMAALPTVSLGTGRTVKNITPPIGIVSAGGCHTCVVMDNNVVKCWGDNSYDPPTPPDPDFGGPIVGVGVPGSTALKVGAAPGEVPSSYTNMNLGSGRTGKAVSVGPLHTCVLMDNNQVKCWGSNPKGELGLGDTQSRGWAASQMGNGLPTILLGTSRTARSISAGNGATCVALDNGRAKCWGDGSSYQLGTGGTWNIGDLSDQMGDNILPIELGGRTISAAATGDFHTCTMFPNGQVTCWGSNLNGQLGLTEIPVGGNLTYAAYGYVANLGMAAKGIGAGGSHTCALLNNNQLKCWGQNSSGQLGMGDTVQRSVPASSTISLGSGQSAQKVAAGHGHTCALLASNLVKCWGGNASGQLGLGDTTQRNAPVTATVSLGSSVTVSELAVGALHTCARLNTNQIKCWGSNLNGQLGLGNTNNRGDNSGEMGSSLPTVSLGSGRSAKALAVGGHHTCALLDNNTVKCWGSNFAGQLGLGNDVDRLSPPTTTVNLGTGRTAKAIAAGVWHTCAVLDNDRTKCWGWNGDGTLGNGDPDLQNVGDDPGEMGDALPVIEVGMGVGLVSRSLVGAWHTCALLSSNQLSCWGYNSNGQLGDSFESTNVPPAYPIWIGLEP